MIDTPDFRGRIWFALEGGTDEELQQIGQVVSKYVRAVVDLKDVRTQRQALFEVAGYNELPDRAKVLFGWALQLVMFGAYFHGYREMESGGPAKELQLYHVQLDTPGFFGRWWGYVRAEWRRLVRRAENLCGREHTAPERA